MQSHSHAKCITFTRHSLITNLNAIIGMKREITTTALIMLKKIKNIAIFSCQCA